jgi:hypothetical protein
MADVLRSFDEPIRHASGSYRARVVGRLAKDGMWEGWLEFVPLEPGQSEVIVSSVESRQPAREHLVYWAQGLSVVYAEGSLDRARHPITVRARVADVAASNAPAPRVVVESPRGAAPGPEAVLDPFEIGMRSLDILAQELRALNRPRLLNVIAAYELNPGGEDVAWMSDEQLARFIVVAVDAQLLKRAP